MAAIHLGTVTRETSVMSKASESASGSAAEKNMLRFDQEAFDAAVELQMSFLETATRFARECAEFTAHRVESNAEDFTRFVGAKSPSELMQMQLDHMRAMFEDYSAEAGRLIALSEGAVKEGGEAVRSAYLDKTPLKKAS
jgi:hypothetical protein